VDNDPQVSVADSGIAYSFAAFDYALIGATGDSLSYKDTKQEGGWVGEATASSARFIFTFGLFFVHII